MAEGIISARDAATRVYTMSTLLPLLRCADKHLSADANRKTVPKA